MSSQAIGAVNDRVVAAFGRQDAAAVVACYTADGKLMAPFAPSHVGRDAIERAVGQVFAGGVAALTLDTVTLEILEDTAWEEGAFTVADAAGTQLDRGKYIVIWKKVGDDWLMARDIMSSDLPAPAAG